MAGDRRINWGADATDARYRTEDTGDGANFVVAEDLDGSTVLLEYDDSATPSEWKFRGPVEMNSNDISGVGTLTASTVNADVATINNVAAKASLTTNQTISTGTVTNINLDSVKFEETTVADVDLTNNQIVLKKAGVYLVDARVVYAGSSNWSSGDAIQCNIRDKSTPDDVSRSQVLHEGVNDRIAVETVGLIDAAANTNIGMQGYHNRGGDETIFGNSVETQLQVARLG